MLFAAKSLLAAGFAAMLLLMVQPSESPRTPVAAAELSLR